MNPVMHHRSVDEWCSWFRANAERYFLDNRARSAWQEVPGVFHPHSTIVAQIVKYSETMDRQDQDLFRKGLGKCLTRGLPWRKEYIAAFDLYIRLCQALGYAELIESKFFERALFNGPLGYFDEDRRAEDSDSLFETARMAIRSFAKSGYGDRVVPLIRRMVKSNTCPKSTVYWMFVTMCEAEPEKLYDHWLSVRPIHQELQATLRHSNSKTGVAVIARELSAYVSLETFGSELFKIFNIVDFRSSDYWLINALCNGHDAPLVILRKATAKSHELVIMRRGHPAEVRIRTLRKRQIDNILSNEPFGKPRSSGTAFWYEPLVETQKEAAMIRLEVLYGLGSSPVNFAVSELDAPFLQDARHVTAVGGEQYLR